MTDDQVGMLAAAMLQLNRGFLEIVRTVLEQEAEIAAIRSLLERKGVAHTEELERAQDDAIQKLQEGFPAGRIPRCRRVSGHCSFGGARSAV